MGKLFPISPEKKKLLEKDAYIIKQVYKETVINLALNPLSKLDKLEDSKDKEASSQGLLDILFVVWYSTIEIDKGKIQHSPRALDLLSCLLEIALYLIRRDDKPAGLLSKSHNEYENINILNKLNKANKIMVESYGKIFSESWFPKTIKDNLNNSITNLEKAIKNLKYYEEHIKNQATIAKWCFKFLKDEYDKNAKLYVDTLLVDLDNKGYCLATNAKKWYDTLRKEPQPNLTLATKPQQ